MMKRDFTTCVVFGSAALVAGVMCHRLGPGLGSLPTLPPSPYRGA